MKTNAKILTLAVALLAVPAALQAAPALTDPVVAPAAPTSFSLTTYHLVNSSALRVYVQKTNATPVSITLRNAKGIALYEDKLGKKENTKALSLIMREQPDGEYTLEVSNGTEKVTKSFTLKTPQRTIALN